MKLVAFFLPFGRSHFLRSGNLRSIVIRASELLMKSPLSLILLLTTTTLAFGQGKLSFDIDSVHLIYFATDKTKLLPADANKIVNGYPLAGSGLYTGAGSTIAALSGSPTIIAGLWAGTSSNSLTLQTTTTIRDLNLEGQVVSVPCTFASLPAGTPAWFQVQVYDSRSTSAGDSWGNLRYAGMSQIFQATPQAAVPSPMWQTGPPVNSTWAAGTFEPVDMVQYGPGYYGAIVVYTRLDVILPYIYTQPQSTTNYWGQSATFTVGANGLPVPSYQWKANGTTLHDGPHVSGSGSNQLTLSGITLTDAGTYQVIVSNVWGRATSDPATLTVLLISPSISSVIPQPDGAVTLNLTGTPNSTNRLWATADLTPPAVWSPVSTNVASSGGTWQVTDTEGIGWTTRFYRASMP